MSQLLRFVPMSFILAVLQLAVGCGDAFTSGPAGAGGGGGAASSVASASSSGMGGASQGGSSGETTTSGGGGQSQPVCGPGKKPVSMTGISICYVIAAEDHPTGKYLGISGSFTDPNGTSVSDSPFQGCVAKSNLDNQVVCNFTHDFKVGSDLNLQLGLHKSNAYENNQTVVWLCNPLSTVAKCKGELWVYKDGQQIGHFFHPPAQVFFVYVVNAISGFWDLQFGPVPS